MAELEILDASARHTLDLYRYNTGVYQKMLAHLQRSEIKLTNQLSELVEGMTNAEKDLFMRNTYKGKRLTELREAIQNLSHEYRTIINDGIRDDAVALAANEIDHALNLSSAVINVEGVHSISAAQVYSAAVAQPFNGRHLRDYIADIEPYVRKRINQSLRIGFSNGETVQEMVKTIRGTKVLKYKDGLLKTSKTSAERLVRTFNNHLASRAHIETFKALGVDQYKWASTLDFRTSSVCSVRDGQIYDIGKGPLPPAHPNCLHPDTIVASSARISNVFKRAYEGLMIEIVTKSGRSIKITPNHPVLTRGGWKPAGAIDCIDDLAFIEREGLGCYNEDLVVSKFSDLHSSLGVVGSPRRMRVRPEDFHGDITSDDVDTIDVSRLGIGDIKSSLLNPLANNRFIDRVNIRRPFNSFCSFYFTGSTSCSSCKPIDSLFRELYSLLTRIVRAPYLGLIRLASYFNAAINKLFFDSVSARFNSSLSAYRLDCCTRRVFHDNGCSFFSGEYNNMVVNNPSSGLKDFRNPFPSDATTKMFSDFFDRHFPFVMHLANKVLIDKCTPVLINNSSRLKCSSNPFSINEESIADFSDSHTIDAVEFDNVVGVNRFFYSGHVYNLENDVHWYTSNDIITHNCRSAVTPYWGDDYDGERPFVRAFVPVSKIPKNARDGVVGTVSAKTNYATWFKRQSEVNPGFAKRWLGASRYELYKTGKFPLDRLVDYRGRAYNLDEIRQKNKLLWKDVFGD